MAEPNHRPNHHDPELHREQIRLRIRALDETVADLTEAALDGFLVTKKDVRRNIRDIASRANSLGMYIIKHGHADGEL
jgi:hypothetical protein